MFTGGCLQFPSEIERHLGQLSSKVPNFFFWILKNSIFFFKLPIQYWSLKFLIGFRPGLYSGHSTSFLEKIANKLWFVHNRIILLTNEVLKKIFVVILQIFRITEGILDIFWTVLDIDKAVSIPRFLSQNRGD